MGGVLIVTGGGRGIGAACARLAGSRGFRVAVNYKANAERAEAVAEALRATGGEAITIQADVADEGEVIAMFETVDARLGPVTALINNAGMTGHVGRLTDFSAAEIDAVLRLNVTGAMVCAREAVKRMSTAQGGSGGVIVNISSAAAQLGGANQYLPYAASKAALEAFTKGLGLEVAREGIRVVGLRPGVIDTEIHAAMGMPERARELAPTIPLGRAGSPEEVAQAALWLIGDDASYITATTISVTGGR
ncbi:MAG TPA: SDR family oxidoreductase [Alphaproteobacteria bacterium]|nr:SDR family oxidoreductase [Alphaproteobacteria bacterium]